MALQWSVQHNELIGAVSNVVVEAHRFLCGEANSYYNTYWSLRDLVNRSYDGHTVVLEMHCDGAVALRVVDYDGGDFLQVATVDGERLLPCLPTEGFGLR